FPAEIEVTDSIAPADDLNMPFGEVFVGVDRTENLIITNNDDTRDLVISKIELGRRYSENFDDGLAQDWDEDKDANWEVVSGEYRAQTSDYDFMFSTYAGCEWADVAAQVDCRRTGSGGVPAGVSLRASSNFDEGVGSAYCFQIYTYGYFIVWKQVNGKFTYLQDLTQSSVISSGNNTLLAVADGNLLQFFINGSLVWSGVDNALNSGRIGLGGVSFPEAVAVYYFDNVSVADSRHVLGASSATISPEQQWYNQQPYQGLDWKGIPENIDKLVYPDGDDDSNNSPLTGIQPLSVDDFHLELPPDGPPWIVTPLSSMAVPVTFEPTAFEENDTVIVIRSNDEDEPEVEVQISGTGLQDYLDVSPNTDLEFIGHPGGPFSPSSRNYVLTNIGPTLIEWEATKTVTWLDLSATSGSLGSGSDIVVTASLNAEAHALGEGEYTDTLVFTNTTSGVASTRKLTLIIQRLPKIWVEPESIEVSVPEGGATGDTITIGNVGDADLHFYIKTRDAGRSVIPAGSINNIENTGQSIVIEYVFEKPTATKFNNYTLLTMKGLEQYQRTGAPIVPVRPVRLLIPYGNEIVNIRAIPLDMVELSQKVQLPPGQKPYPLSHVGPIPTTEPDQNIYNQHTPWPGFYHQQVGVQSKCGYHLLVVTLFPLQYTPVTQTVSYCRKIRLEVDLADAANKAPASHASPAVRKSVSCNVDNPAALSSYDIAAKSNIAEDSPLPLGTYNYVIITSENLENTPGPWNLQALLDEKAKWGITGTIVTTHWISSNYDGTRPSGGEDLQTRIRNFLIDAYQGWGTRYALLAGANSTIPARMFYSS
ncbi:MAG: C25 family cysteine peptidase, partial [Planctomycetota bacterium]